MVVVLVIAIVLAIAIPTFLGAVRRAQDRQAQSNVRNAVTVQESYFGAHRRYTGDVAELQSLEGRFDWTRDAPKGVRAVPVVGGLLDDGIDKDGDGQYNCNVNTSNGVSIISPDCSAPDAGICVRSRSRSGMVFLMVKVVSEAEAETYYGRDRSCPGSRSELTTWSSSGW